MSATPGDGLLALPVRRPVATAMVFSAIVLLGLVGWRRIPVELLPDLAGDELYVSFFRPGSEPEVVERELLMPLEARVATLAGVEESWGQVRGSAGSFRVRFEPGTDLELAELELQRLAAELARSQPRGSAVEVSAQDLAALSKFVMVVEVVGGDDRASLRALVDERIQPRLAAVSGVSRVLVSGGGAHEATVRLDPARCAALGVTPTQVTQAVARAVGRLDYLGGAEADGLRRAVMLDGQPRGLVSLGNTRVGGDRPVLLRHVAELSFGPGDEESVLRVDGRPAVGLIVFQEEGANLVRLGRALRERIAAVDQELAPYAVDLGVGYDAAHEVEAQLDRLEGLALSGFGVALAVLLLFLREVRAVLVVAVAVPVSLLAAVALLYLGGWTINLITLFGLAVGIGMLVDNSIVVYEAVQRRLERGVAAERAAVAGVRTTVRAIVAASGTNAIVFLPVAFATDDSMVRGLLTVMAVAILLPLAGSLLVALGLVPLLAHRLAAPAAQARIRASAARREELAGLVQPDRWREVFSGLLKVALRRPAGWLGAVAAAILLTVVIALPWVAVSTATQEAREADEVRVTVEVKGSDSLEATGDSFAVLEQAALDLAGVTSVETFFEETGGTVTVRLAAPERRPPDLSAGRVREVLRQAGRGLKGLEVRTVGSGEDGGSDGGGGGFDALLGSGPAEVVVSGPDARRLGALAAEIEARLESIPEVAEAWTASRYGQDELRVLPRATALAAYGLTADEILPGLVALRREGVMLATGLTLADGREVPLVVRAVADPAVGGAQAVERLRLATRAGVLPLAALADTRTVPAPPAIQHHNGRRELAVYYRFGERAPATGPARQELDRSVRDAMREAERPSGYTVTAAAGEETTSWFKRLLVPILLLLFALLAVTFESLTVPALVLAAVPLTVLGATWALVLSGTPAGMMALVGVVALIGVTVNPAILLVDRMQHRARRGWSAGAAALAAVRERARAVLMTTATTVAGLWPLALSTGRDLEIWPPFATVMMGGLATSALLTLLVIPVGFVLLHRLDLVFGRLGPWVVVAWLGATSAVMAPLVVTGTVASLTWQVVTTLLVAGLLLGVAVLLLNRPRRPEPGMADGPPLLSLRFLSKVYGRPGPIGRAWRAGEHFAERVLAAGGQPFAPAEARQSLVTLVVVLAGVGYLALSLTSTWWRLVASFAAAALVAAGLRQLRRWRGLADPLGRVVPGGVEGLLAGLAPWLVLATILVRDLALPLLAEEAPPLPPVAAVVVTLVVAVVTGGRATARALAAGRLTVRPEGGLFARLRWLWRSTSRALFSFGLAREEVRALTAVHLEIGGGMVGVLGPNGAGKTTLLRLVAGILEPSLGTITVGGVRLERIRSRLARWVGYLPQEFGLPDDLSAREYLDYYALLYDLGDAATRRERVDSLLAEVGLGERADERIGGYSGGMRQRVAVARTLLRLPPVIIVDEPTVGLDPRERIRFRNLLARLAHGRVVLFSTHVVEDVAVACERVIVMSRGEVVFDGPPPTLAAAAAGRVWVVHQPRDEDPVLPAGARVVDRVPEEGGGARLRVLADERPGAAAEAAAPTVEDGYLLLVHDPSHAASVAGGA